MFSIYFRIYFKYNKICLIDCKILIFFNIEIFLKFLHYYIYINIFLFI